MPNIAVKFFSLALLIPFNVQAAEDPYVFALENSLSNSAQTLVPGNDKATYEIEKCNELVRPSTGEKKGKILAWKSAYRCAMVFITDSGKNDVDINKAIKATGDIEPTIINISKIIKNAYWKNNAWSGSESDRDRIWHSLDSARYKVLLVKMDLKKASFYINRTSKLKAQKVLLSLLKALDELADRLQAVMYYPLSKKN